MRGAVVVAALTVALLGACGGSSSSPPKVDAEALLRQAKATIDNAEAAHFSLTSSNVGGGVTAVTGGHGDLARPDQLQGSFSVQVSGFEASVKVVSKGGVFEAQLPFQSHYTRTNPSSFGLTNPAQLLAPSGGLSDLLTAGTGGRVTGQERINGELLDEVTTTVPGRSIPVLPDADPSQAVSMLVAIDPDSHQVRQIRLTGPFIHATSDTTFVVTLTDYNERVTITLPAT